MKAARYHFDVWISNAWILLMCFLSPNPGGAYVSAVRYAYNHVILAQHSSQLKSREFHERFWIALACYWFWRQSCLPSPASSCVFCLCPFCAGTSIQPRSNGMGPCLLAAVTRYAYLNCRIGCEVKVKCLAKSVLIKWCFLRTKVDNSPHILSASSKLGDVILM